MDFSRAYYMERCRLGSWAGFQTLFGEYKDLSTLNMLSRPFFCAD